MPKTASAAVLSLVGKVTRQWTKQIKREERGDGRSGRQYVGYSVSQKTVCEEELPGAYKKASANGTLPATARQIYYVLRDAVQARCSADRPFQYGYFAQTLLKNYIEEWEPDWDIVWDDRGHFDEPHGENGSIGLGTIRVRNFLEEAEEGATMDEEIAIEAAKVELNGPDQHYGAILFIEKEGFMPLFEKVELAQRYDIAIMSAKGMSTAAARLLADTLCAKHDIPLLVLHDFDASGFSILGTLRRDTKTYKFVNEIKVIDLGLRLADVRGLPCEEAGARISAEKLAENGATPQEIAFVQSQRVELNMLTADQLVAFVERKLDKAGIKKVVPDTEWLERVYRRAVAGAAVSEKLEEILEEADDKVKVPANLDKKVRRYLKQHPAESWHAAVIALAAPNGDTPTEAGGDPDTPPDPKQSPGRRKSKREYTDAEIAKMMSADYEPEGPVEEDTPLTRARRAFAKEDTGPGGLSSRSARMLVLGSVKAMSKKKRAVSST